MTFISPASDKDLRYNRKGGKTRGKAKILLLCYCRFCKRKERRKGGTGRKEGVKRGFRRQEEPAKRRKSSPDDRRSQVWPRVLGRIRVRKPDQRYGEHESTGAPGPPIQRLENVKRGSQEATHFLLRLCRYRPKRFYIRTGYISGADRSLACLKRVGYFPTQAKSSLFFFLSSSARITE